ncbi:MAG: outer membrane protein assembly factor BamA [Desulfurivibrionaceae bacterium]|nr:outer membrane protein assembly factor BamA [Desulfobulbales bacterium]MDT8334822.1 outer membrane protein assembly factor BamA [Desulfurivibrionaceae bacterium]
MLMGLGILVPAGVLAAEPNGEQAVPASGRQAPNSVQFRVRITGNHELSTETLQAVAAEELHDFRRAGFSSADADDAAYQMELVYRNLGYRFATVDYGVERPADGEPILIFTVEEGVRVRLTEIVPVGNVDVPTETLLDFFTAQAAATPAGGKWLVESSLTAAVDRIRNYYYTNGYLQAEVGAPQFTFSGDRSSVSVLVAIDEGSRFIVHDLDFTGELLPEVADDLAEIRETLVGRPYVPRQSVFLPKSRVIELYGNLGYPDARVEVARRDDPQAPATAVVLEVLIDSGPRVTIAGLRITGNDKTEKEFIVSRLKLSPGEIYSTAKERASFSGLYRTGLFSLVRLSMVETEVPERRLLLVELEELPGRELSFELGWGSYELLRGKVEMRNRNFTGRGRILSASAAASLKSTDLSLGYSDPWLFGRDLVFDLPIYRRTRTEPSFDRTETGISTVLSKRFGEPRVGVSLAYLLRYTQQSSVSVDVREAGENYNFASVKLQASRDSRDDLFFPAAGYRSLVAVEITDQALGSSLAFVRFTTTNRFFYSVGLRTVLGVRYDTGFVVPTTEDLTLPLAERFFNGGAGTVRSFRESELGPKDPLTGDPLGGSAYNVFSLELRHRFKHNFGGSLFLDYGNVAPSGDRTLDHAVSKSAFISATFGDYFSNFRAALGIGIQYILPVGPLRLDCAFNPAVDEAQREDEFTVHLTVGMAF